MVKILDENTFPPLIDHLGWQLWQTSESWKALFTGEMAERGHPWFAEARGALLRFIGPSGILQSELAGRAGISKQAVQQLLDQLERDGIIERLAGAIDLRAKRVILTKQGLAAMRDANDAKRSIESRLARQLGREKLASLTALLAELQAAALVLQRR